MELQHALISLKTSVTVQCKVSNWEFAETIERNIDVIQGSGYYMNEFKELHLNNPRVGVARKEGNVLWFGNTTSSLTIMDSNIKGIQKNVREVDIKDN